MQIDSNNQKLITFRPPPITIKNKSSELEEIPDLFHTECASGEINIVDLTNLKSPASEQNSPVFKWED